MIYILVITKDFEKWIEKFSRNLYFDYWMVKKINANEYHLKNEMFNIELISYCGDNLRGKAPNMIIIDKPMKYEDINMYLRPLLGRNDQIVYGDNYRDI